MKSLDTGAQVSFSGRQPSLCTVTQRRWEKQAPRTELPWARTVRSFAPGTLLDPAPCASSLC